MLFYVVIHANQRAPEKKGTIEKPNRLISLESAQGKKQSTCSLFRPKPYLDHSAHIGTEHPCYLAANHGDPVKQNDFPKRACALPDEMNTELNDPQTVLMTHGIDISPSNVLHLHLTLPCSMVVMVNDLACHWLSGSFGRSAERFAYAKFAYTDMCLMAAMALDGT